jgi:uncharacterized protein (DUF58 family)
VSALLNNATIAQIKDIELRTRMLARGAIHGHHQSNLRGLGIEFNQFRTYEPGDEPSKIDWKLFSRSDRYFVREAEKESAINVWGIVDCSESMLEQSRSGHWHKLDYAKNVLAAIGYLSHHQGDGIGLLGINNHQLEYLPALQNRQHYHRYLLALESLNASEYFPSWEQYASHVHAARQNSLVVLLSDFYQQNDEVFALAKNLHHANCQVLAVQLETNDEINFDFDGVIEFTERETGKKQKVSSQSIRDDYLINRAAFNDKLSQSLAKADIGLLRLNIDKPAVEGLRQIASSMASMAQRGIS